jgi:hypothetical protein
MWSSSRVVLLCSLLALGAAAGGCRPGRTGNLALVEGTVIKDGRALRGIEVVFLPDAGMGGPRAVSRTDEAGHYRLRTDNGEDGAVVGNYRVLVLAPEVVSRSSMERIFDGSQQKETRWLSPEMAQRLENQRNKMGNTPQVPPGYRLYNETPLRAEVQFGSQVINFEVK